MEDYHDILSPLQIEHYWARLRIPGLHIHPSQCHSRPLEVEEASEESPESPEASSESHPSLPKASPPASPSLSPPESPPLSPPAPPSLSPPTSPSISPTLSLYLPPPSPPPFPNLALISSPSSSSPTPFFKPPPPSSDPDLFLTTLRHQATTSLTALFGLVLDLERKGAVQELGRAGFWERVADGETWLPPSGKRMRAFEVVVLVLEVDYARGEYKKMGCEYHKHGYQGCKEGGYQEYNDYEWRDQDSYDGGKEDQYEEDGVSTDEEDGGGDIRTELEALVDEYSRVWRKWEAVDDL